MADADLAELLSDPRWLAHRYSAAKDELHFVWLTRDDHRRAAFLSDLPADPTRPQRVVPRAALVGVDIPQAPLHLILHSGLAGSTLLARALDQPGVVMTLKEPPLLSNVAAASRGGGGGPLIEAAARLVARPFGSGEAVIVKCGSVANALGVPIAGVRDDTRLLALHTPLDLYLASLAGKGLWGRLWGRRLFLGLANAGLVDLGIEGRELLEQTDLQLAACAWLSIHRLLGEALARFGPARARSVDSRLLRTELPPTLEAIAAFLAIDLDVAAATSPDLLSRDSKTGESFDPKRRQAELDAALDQHRQEIELVVGWAEKVADVARIAWTLPHPLGA